MASTTSSAIPLAQLTAPLLLGMFGNWGLFGVLTVQVYIYHLAFPADRRLVKCIALSVLMFETLQTVLITRDGFRIFGAGWGDEAALTKVGWIWFSVPAMSALIGCGAQTFFAWRIYMLSRRLYIPAVVELLSVLQCVAGVWTGGLTFVVADFRFVQQHEAVTTPIWLGGTALCDVIIACSMMYYLSRSKPGFSDTQTLISRIIRVTVETGLLCAALAITDLTLFMGWRDNNYHVAPALTLSKVYANSLLVILNARARIVPARSRESRAVESRLVFTAGDTVGHGHSSKATASSIRAPPTPTNVYAVGQVPIATTSQNRYADDDVFTIPESDWSINMTKLEEDRTASEPGHGMAEGSHPSRPQSQKSGSVRSRLEGSQDFPALPPAIISPMSRKVFEQQRCDSLIFSDACFEDSV